MSMVLCGAPYGRMFWTDTTSLCYHVRRGLMAIQVIAGEDEYVLAEVMPWNAISLASGSNV